MKIFTLPVITKEDLSETTKKKKPFQLLDFRRPCAICLLYDFMNSKYYLCFESTSTLLFVSEVTYGRSAVIFLSSWPVEDES